MRVLLLGASGFIGRELLAALAARGHRVTAGVRRRAGTPPFGADLAMTLDLNHATDVEAWTPLLADCDAVVNCAGVLQGTRAQSIDAIHRAAPIALFQACERVGVRRVVQISAISAELAAGTAYAVTKLAADDHLRSTSLEWTVLRPSLVVARGAHGGTAFFRALAALPFAIPVPGDGHQAFQPIHVADLAQLVATAVEDDLLVHKTIDVVGPDVVTLRRLLEDYRRWLGLAPVPVLSIPRGLVRAAAWLGGIVGGPLNATALAQLDYGNTGDFAAFERVAGVKVRTWRNMLAMEPAHAQDRWHARLYFVRPLLRASLAVLWVVSAIAGAFAIAPWAPRLASAAALPAAWTGAILAALCLLDLGIGMLVWRRWRPPLVALLQMIVIGGYTVVATLLWPSLWADPLGVLLKNLPILAAVLALGAIEEER